MGETDHWTAESKPYVTRTQEKGAVTPQKTEPDLPVNIQESLAWLGYTVACHRVRGIECNSPGGHGTCWHKSF